MAKLTYNDTRNKVEYDEFYSLDIGECFECKNDYEINIYIKISCSTAFDIVNLQEIYIDDNNLVKPVKATITIE